jgi:outer membrane protein assembly factor BamB
MNGTLTKLALCSALIASADNGRSGDWPQWRGPSRTGYAAADALAPTALPRELKPLWKISVGGGFSAPIVSGDKLVYLDEQQGKETAHLLEAATGKELWHVEYAAAFQDEWGIGPRATPIIDEDRLYVQSCDGEFRCLDLKDGKTIWRTNYEKDFGVKFVGSKANSGTASRRGNNGSGVIDGDRIVLPVGSTEGASLVCFDKKTGKVLWKSGDDEAAYSSFMIGTLGGVKQVVALTADALLGADLANGKILWRVPLKTNAKRHAASPVIGDDTVMVNSHTFGLIRYKISRDSGGLKATEDWANRDLKINLATPVVVGKHLYCQGPDKDYICADATSGELKWSQPGFGAGKKDYSSTIVVGANLLVLTEDGTLLLLEANPAKYRELGRLQVCGNTWSFPAYAEGRLFVRDGRQLLCLDLAAKQ